MSEMFSAWVRSLEDRHLADLTFAEVSRALRALSSTYVEHRRRITSGGVFDGAGKRAAFALFYAPMHYLLVREIVAAIPSATGGHAMLVDLGCGTGAAGAAWAAARRRKPRILAIDRHPWTLGEAAKTYRAFGLSATTVRGDMTKASAPKEQVDVLAAFALNELENADRERLLERLVERTDRGDRVLVIEPLARAAAPWWGRWQHVFEARGGRADEWRVRVELPEIVRKLDRAVGLDHRELTGRSLWLERGGDG